VFKLIGPKMAEVKERKEVTELIEKLRAVENILKVTLTDGVIHIQGRGGMQGDGGYSKASDPSIRVVEMNEWCEAVKHLKKVKLQGFWIDCYLHIKWFIEVGLELELFWCPIWSRLEVEMEALKKKAGDKMKMSCCAVR
jgi:hypothetical protein